MGQVVQFVQDPAHLPMVIAGAAIIFLMLISLMYLGCKTASRKKLTKDQARRVRRFQASSSSSAHASSHSDHVDAGDIVMHDNPSSRSTSPHMSSTETASPGRKSHSHSHESASVPPSSPRMAPRSPSPKKGSVAEEAYPGMKRATQSRCR